MDGPGQVESKEGGGGGDEDGGQVELLLPHLPVYFGNQVLPHFLFLQLF